MLRGSILEYKALMSMVSWINPITTHRVSYSFRFTGVKFHRTFLFCRCWYRFECCNMRLIENICCFGWFLDNGIIGGMSRRNKKLTICHKRAYNRETFNNGG
jgi:hypothetical protein